ncbi:MAG: class I SAM-dependent methyltransferase [Chloroflexi bacterium]|nr:class I SAM-dependent methyltransferase [Chloroflexota bacterium]
MTLEDLKRIAASVGERRGWDFSRVRDDRDPVPWDYADVVRRYLQLSSRVLDIGTGGGERFLALAPHFGAGVGIDADPTMIQVARENTPPSLVDKVSFEVMRAEALGFPDAAYDVVLNRHASVYVEEIVRVLRSDGIFIISRLVEETRRTSSPCLVGGRMVSTGANIGGKGAASPRTLPL